jgi:diguanylate cyclase (GGDEF)-like protein
MALMVSQYASVWAFRQACEGVPFAASGIELLSVAAKLTGVPNKRRLDEEQSYALARAAREGENLALVMADIDGFKAFNDRYGGQAGDDCLRRIAGNLASCLERATDILGRYGGEEFLVILPHTALEGARVVAERIRGSVQALLVKASEQALCLAKQRGGIRVCD